MSDYERFTALREETERQGMQVDLESDSLGHTVTVDHAGYFGKGRAQWWMTEALLLALEDLKQTESRYRRRRFL